MPPALESEPLRTLFIYFLPPVTYFYSQIIVTVTFYYHVLFINPPSSAKRWCFSDSPTFLSNRRIFLKQWLPLIIYHKWTYCTGTKVLHIHYRIQSG